MLRIRGFVLGALALALLPGARAADGYRDVPQGHWAFEEVEWVRGSDLLPDSGGARFEGDKGLSRYEMAGVLAGYMRTYYGARDAIDAELEALHQADAGRQGELQELRARGEALGERMASYTPVAGGAELPPALSEPTPPAPTTRSSSLAERLAALRAKVRASRGAAEPATATAPPPVVDPEQAEEVWDQF